MKTPHHTDDPFRIVVLGDFSGRSSRGVVASASQISSRGTLRVDRDEVDTAIARIAPELHIVLDAGSPMLTVRFDQLDDFHPDRLVERLPVFRQLRALREEVAQRGEQAPPRQRQTPPRADASARAMAEGSLLDLIIDGDPPSTAKVRSARPPDELAAFIKQAVAAHVVAQPSAEQAELIGQIDSVIEAMMRALLHHPEFQTLEASWRSMDFLLRRLETDDQLRVYLIDLSFAELAADLGAPGGASGSAIRKLLDCRTSPGTTDARTLVVANYMYGPGDVELLSQLAALGRAVGAPVIAGASPLLAGAASIATQPDPDDWDIALPAAWEELRRSEDSVWLALALPRLFLRLPYGKSTNACTLRFEEFGDGPTLHASYLWGTASVACALVVAEGIARDGSPGTHGTIDGLPFHVIVGAGEAVQVPCAEAFLTQRAVAKLLDLGLTPLASMRDGDSVRAPRIQSIATPPHALAFAVGGPR